MFDDLLRFDGVAERLVHGAAFAIEHPSVEGAGAVRRAPLEPHAYQQGAVEPAAVLIAAFQVEIRGPCEAVRSSQHGQMAGSGIEPDVQDVGLFAELNAAALSAGDS